MNKTFQKLALLACAGLALAGAPAKAQIVYNDKDLIVAFGPAAHTGNTYMVDIGNISNFRSGGLYYNPGNAVVINSGSASSYLSDISTAGLTVGTAVWSVFGADYS